MRPDWNRSAIALAAGALAGGCVDRQITVTSDPPGARVWLNDTEVGVTPVATGFKFYGTYDVRVEHAGFEPVHTRREAHAPIHEIPGIDLVAMASPVRLTTDIAWHFDLTPIAEDRQPTAEFEADLIERARALRARVEE